MRSSHNTSPRFTLLTSFVWFVIAACSPESADPIAGPDAAPPPAALDPSGTFAVTSSYSLAAPPPDLAPLLAELASATDGPDDPTAYLVDLVVAELPEGSARTVATVLAPFVAAELHGRIAAYAPALVPALRDMALGATRISTRFSTLEHLVVTADPPASTTALGRARRTIRGIRVDGTDIAFSSIGLADTSVDTELSVQLVGMAARVEAPSGEAPSGEAPSGEAPSGEAPGFASMPAPTWMHRIVIAQHVAKLPVGAWFRPAFDRAVIPSIVPGATDLSSALRELVDCPRLGALIAEAVGLGSSSLYAQACTVGLGVAARRIYEEFPHANAEMPASPHALALVGTALAIDRDGDGVMDAIDHGVWTGVLGNVSVGTSVFEGASR